MHFTFTRELSVSPGTLSTVTTDIVPAAPGRTVAALGLTGWLGTMSPHSARAYAGDLRQFTAWLTSRDIAPEAVTPGVTTAWLADLEAAGQQVATRRRKLAAVLSFYRYAAAEGVRSVGHPRLAGGRILNTGPKAEYVNEPSSAGLRWGRP